MTLVLKQHWFWPLTLVLMGMVWTITRFAVPGSEAELEPALLFDVLVTIPALFALCYAGTLPGKQLALRIVALQCLGIWLAGKIIPVQSQSLLLELGWLRTLGLAVLFAIELRLAAALFRLVFRGDTKQSDLQELGMPPLVAKIALAEARFWRWMLSAFRK